mmetsp:Transcript_46878/g.106306  ORF Transcript_46878/g.106306 Transcript_46878/m.106306 type:complete len:502 (-) Transcript_46878:117-1622(-)
MDSDDDDDHGFQVPNLDDIEAFERNLKDRNGHGAGVNFDVAEDEASSDDDVIRQARAMRQPLSNADWQAKCDALELKLGQKEFELQRAHEEMDLLRQDMSVGGIDNEVKQKLLELTKKNRRQTTTLETQKSKIRQLQTEVKKLSEGGAGKPAQDVPLNVAHEFGMEDFRKKYLTASNKLQELRHEFQSLKVLAHRQKKVLLKELGTEEHIEKALAVVDDPVASSWKGRAVEIKQLKAQVSSLQQQCKQLKQSAGSAPGSPAGGAMPEVDESVEKMPKVSRDAGKAAEQRREKLDSLQAEVDQLKEAAEADKKRRTAQSSRNKILEDQVRELRNHVQTLVTKSEHDDELVEEIYKQLRSVKGSANGRPDSGQPSEEVQQLKSQVERQAAIIQALRNKTMSDVTTEGAIPIGKMQGDATAEELFKRARYLEVENQRQAELLSRLEGQSEGSRPGSSESLSALQKALKQAQARINGKEAENRRLKSMVEDLTAQNEELREQLDM